MKKYLKTSVLASALVLGLGTIAAGAPAFAADDTNTDSALFKIEGSGGSQYVSPNQELGSETDTAHITADKTGVGGVGISHAGIGWQAGNLILNQVPNFDFGKNHTLHGGEEDFDLLTTTTDDKGTEEESDDSSVAISAYQRALIVSDQRTDAGVTEGWDVTLQMGQFHKDGEDTGATLYDGDGDIAGDANPITLKLASTTTNDVANLDGAYVHSGLWAEVNGSASFVADTSSVPDPADPADEQTGVYAGNRDLPPEAVAIKNSDTAGNNDELIHAGGSAHVVWQATANSATGSDPANGEGAGTWALDFLAAKSATLHVPDQYQKTGTFISTLTWTLTSAPIQ